MKEYGVQIDYSWGEEEPFILAGTKEDSWDKAKQLALGEVETACYETGSEIGLLFDRENDCIALHYVYDDTWCYFRITEAE